MNIIHKARGSELQRHQQRVFLCWSKGNESERDELVKDLLSHDAGVDCIVSWIENPAGDVDEELIKQELLEAQLFVFLVTQQFFDNEPPDFRIAKDISELSKLPLATKATLFPKLTMQDKGVHGIAVDDIEYRTKLKEQLSNFIVSNKTIEEITEKAFLGRLFLSYRKKNIAQARHFMRTFHSEPGFEPLAIWYDNFLTAGRAFVEEIHRSIDDADAFVLLVTPNLLELNEEGKPNFVLADELPYAISKGKKIIAIEVEKTDRAEFLQKCGNIDTYLTLSELSAVKDHLPENTISENIEPYRGYLLGLAYLYGISVEKDETRGLSLLSRAAENHNTDACGELRCFYYNKDLDESFRWGKLALDICEEEYGLDNYKTADAYVGLSSVYKAKSDKEKALECLEKALLIIEKEAKFTEMMQENFLKDNRPWILNGRQRGTEKHEISHIYNEMAKLHIISGHFEKALEFNEKAIAEIESIEDLSELAMADLLQYKATILQKKGSFEEALIYSNKAFDIHEKAAGSDDFLTAGSLYQQASIADDQGDYTKAEEYFLKALSIYERELGEDHIEVLGVYNNLAVVYHHLHRYDESLELYLKYSAKAEKVYGSEAPNVATIYDNIGCALGEQGQYTQAINFFNKALAIKEKVFGTDHFDTAKTYKNLALALRKSAHSVSDSENALDYFQKAYDIFLRLGKPQPDTEQTASGLQNLLLSIGNSYYLNRVNSKEVLAYYQRAWDVQKEVFGTDDKYAASICNKLGQAYYRIDNRHDAQALEWFYKSLAIEERLQGSEGPNTAELYASIGEVLSHQGKYSRAIDMFEKVLALESTLGSNHSAIYQTRASMALLIKNSWSFRRELKKREKARGGR